MKRKIIISLFITVVAVIIVDSFTNLGLTFSSGPPSGYTGSPVDAVPNRNCTACHAGPSATTQTGWITSNIPAGGYKAGSTYTITATATRAGHTRFGFQISPQNSTGAQLGTIVYTFPLLTQSAMGNTKYIEHTTAGTTGTTGFHTWTFDWMAPAAAGSGTVTFYGAFNVTNASNSNSGDTIYLSTLVVAECNLAKPTITAGGPTTFCQGGSVTLTSSAATNYLWSTNATTQSITVSASGNYTVTASNASGCSAVSNPTTVTVNSNPAATITAGGPTTFCQGGSVTLTSSSGTSYLWSTSATTQSINVTTSGNYSVTVQNAAGCSTLSAPTTVTVNPTPPIPAITPAGPISLCQGDTVILTSDIATTYLWNTGATTRTISVTTAGSYSVTVKNAFGCGTPSFPVTVNVNPNPATPTISANGPTIFCEGGSVTLSSSAATSYLWSTGATTQSILVTTSGNYSLTVKNAAGCTSPAASTTVTVNPNPATPAISANGPTIFCEGGSVTLTSSAATSYLWSTGDTTQSILVSTSGNYSLTVKNAAGCTSPAASTAITVNPNPATPIITANGSTTLCTGDSVILTSSAAVSYLWNTGDTTQSINVSVAGNYSVTVADINGCTASSASTAVTVIACTYTSLDLKIFLEGFYLQTDSMVAVADPINYPLLCDTITVELHTDTSAYDLVYSSRNTIDIYGKGSFQFTNVLPHAYYIAVRHRNSIETWSKFPVLFDSPVVSFDFTGPE